MSEVDWSKPIEIRIKDGWLPVEDRGPLLGRLGMRAIAINAMHETGSILVEVVAMSGQLRNAPRKPREWWITKQRSNVQVLGHAWPSEAEAQSCGGDIEIVHVREILDEQEEGKGERNV